MTGYSSQCRERLLFPIEHQLGLDRLAVQAPLDGSEAEGEAQVCIEPELHLTCWINSLDLSGGGPDYEQVAFW